LGRYRVFGESAGILRRYHPVLRPGHPVASRRSRHAQDRRNPGGVDLGATMKPPFSGSAVAAALTWGIIAAGAWSRPACAAPATTSETARAFLGGRTGKVVYLKGHESYIYFVDFSDSILTERLLSADPYCLSPMISPDGTRIVYERNSAIWIRNLVQNSPAPTLIHTRPPLNSQTMEPRWW